MAQIVPKNTDVIVIGGGIVGLASAYELALRGVQVVVVEKGRMAGEQSGLAWGFVRQQDRDPVELPLMVAANKLWPDLTKRLEADIDWRQEGLVALADSEEALAHYKNRAKLEQSHGVDSRLLTPQEVQSHLPGYSLSVLGGLYTASDGHADPLKSTLAFGDAARRLGVEILEHTAVTKLQMSQDRVTGVETTAGPIAAKTVICAAGAHAPKLLRPAGIKFPIRSTRSTVARTHPLPPLTELAVRGPRVSFRQTRSGHVILGGSGPSAADYDITLESFRDLGVFLPNFIANRKMVKLHLGRPLVEDILRSLPFTPTGYVAKKNPFAHTVKTMPQANHEMVETIRRAFHGCYPSLPSVTIDQSWAGIIDTTPDVVPVIESSEKVAGLFIAAGFSGHGFALGPIVGQLLSEWIVDGKPSMPLDGFRLNRFAEKTLSKARKLY